MKPAKLAVALITVLGLAAGFQFGLAAERGPSTPEERAQAVNLARALEQNPLHEGAKDARQWLTVWLIEIPDITVKLCSGLLGPIVGSKENYSSELFAQMMFSSAAYIIENPKKAKDQHAVYLAGVEGTLKAYEAILKEKPEARHAFLDELIEKRNQGELDKHVRQATKKCK